MKSGECFEGLTRKVVDAISCANQYSTSTIKYGFNNTIEGKSGCKHQIDVYWEYMQNQRVKKVIIECKDYGKKVNIGRIRDFFAVMYDIGDVNAWIVSSHGFQKGARRFAEYYGIELKTLTWFENLTFNSNVPDPFLKIISFSIKNKKYEIDKICDHLNFLRFTSSDGNCVSLGVAEFIQLICSPKDLNCKHTKKRIKLHQQWIFSYNDENIRFDTITIEFVFLINSPSTITVSESGVKLTHVNLKNSNKCESFLIKKDQT